jgi:hypothetical protein
MQGCEPCFVMNSSCGAPKLRQIQHGWNENLSGLRRGDFALEAKICLHESEPT